MRKITGLRELRPRFEGFLVDLWGVIHDGERPFAGVVEGLAALATDGARICFVSNSSRLGSQLADSLVSMGLAREHFVDVVSSGDVTRRALVERDPAVLSAWPERPRAIHIGNAAFAPWLFELPFDFVDDLDEAEVVVSTGTVPDRAALETLQARLAPTARRGVPLVCTNPDRVVRTATGLHLAPGAVAHAYADLGGPTFFYGKPHAPIYRAALERIGVAKDRVVGIGDMLDTDVLGARDAGLASVLVTASGVHSADLAEDGDDSLRALCEKNQVTPDHVLERFVW